MVKQLSLIKMRANLFTEGLSQLALAKLLENGTFDEHLARLRETHTALQRMPSTRCGRSSPAMNWILPFPKADFIFGADGAGLPIWKRSCCGRSKRAQA
jgi:hypothetical protein